MEKTLRTISFMTNAVFTTPCDQNTIKVLPWKFRLDFIFGPGELKTISIIYPCNIYLCHVPCSCKPSMIN